MTKLEELLLAYIQRVDELSSRVPDDATPQNMAYRLGEIAGLTKSAKGVLGTLGGVG